MAGKITESAVEIFKRVSESIPQEGSRIVAALKAIVRYPLKVLAAFLLAPILVVRVALNSDASLTRRIIAVVGLVLATLLSYITATFLGTIAGTLIIASTFGILTAIAFFIGTATTIYITVAAMALVFNSICFLVLQMNRQDVIDYLERQIKSDSKSSE